MDVLTGPQREARLVDMRLHALASLTAPTLGVLAVLHNVLPIWLLFALVGIAVLLTAAEVTVTQIIRLRVIDRITRSQDTLRALEIEDFPDRFRR